MNHLYIVIQNHASKEFLKSLETLGVQQSKAQNDVENILQKYKNEVNPWQEKNNQGVFHDLFQLMQAQHVTESIYFFSPLNALFLSYWLKLADSLAVDLVFLVNWEDPLKLEDREDIRNSFQFLFRFFIGHVYCRMYFFNADDYKNNNVLYLTSLKDVLRISDGNIHQRMPVGLISNALLESSMGEDENQQVEMRLLYKILMNKRFGAQFKSYHALDLKLLQKLFPSEKSLDECLAACDFTKFCNKKKELPGDIEYEKKVVKREFVIQQIRKKQIEVEKIVLKQKEAASIKPAMKSKLHFYLGRIEHRFGQFRKSPLIFIKNIYLTMRGEI